MPDYLELIDQVQNRDGPLEIHDALPRAVVSHQTTASERPWTWFLDDLGPEAVDVLCGVLRRNMHRRGIRFVSIDYQMDPRYAPDEGPHVIAWSVDSDGDSPNGQVNGEEPILALMLRAWLNAAETLGWGLEAVPEDENASAR